MLADVTTISILHHTAPTCGDRPSTMKRKRCNIHPAPVPCHPRLVRQQGICRVIRDRPQRSECVGEVMFRPALFEIVFHRAITDPLDVFFSRDFSRSVRCIGIGCNRRRAPRFTSQATSCCPHDPLIGG